LGYLCGAMSLCLSFCLCQFYSPLTLKEKTTKFEYIIGIA
jgi:hypothetical protein